MAEDFESVPFPSAMTEMPVDLDVTYFAQLYETSLTAYDGLLYGVAVTERLNYLGLHERNKRLTGMLFQFSTHHICKPILNCVYASCAYLRRPCVLKMQK
jgi:hypothetical protein